MCVISEEMEGVGIENKIGDVGFRWGRYLGNIFIWWSDVKGEKKFIMRIVE